MNSIVAATLFCVCCLTGADALAQSCPVTPASDALRQITQCLAGADCRGRAVVERENLGPGCEREIEVWSWHGARTSVAIRDRKMCHSRRKNPPDARFFHGLLLPMDSVCGVEDPRLYADASAYRRLWRDAWDAARARIAEDQIVLVINPPTLRSQTHLHIHLLRTNGADFPVGASVVVDSLEGVWAAAERVRQARAWGSARNYGIAVRKRGGAFEVLVEEGLPVNSRNPEDRYGVAED